MTGDPTAFIVTMFLTLLLCGVYPWGVWWTHMMLPRYVSGMDQASWISRWGVCVVWPFTWIMLLILLGLMWLALRAEAWARNSDQRRESHDES